MVDTDNWWCSSDGMITLIIIWGFLAVNLILFLVLLLLPIQPNAKTSSPGHLKFLHFCSDHLL